ncbi:MAG: biopolymer transporter ExbD [Pegethrix bostrychoides GSE-TBD4-15B]|jgi:biopolymer transport protein ExbD|uniref:Biopolymer transporter ExbD n=1 Tax=Pegethrix bostrychoides GSE-TBD4-15B TaxID=2839662 RepID=A0A951P6K0_9CYAN|nr:biopolymer transporter ExbD [Pegethrix bostrychoides GSE-TBD4-15B]
MNFKRSSRRSKIPDVNLVPMLDVLMVVLTFFIIVSMTLTLQQGVEIDLPSDDASPSPEAEPPKVAIIKLDSQGQAQFDDKPAETSALTAQVKAFLAENPKGNVVLQPSEQLPYDQVVTLLGDLKQAGGERVSLAIE